MGKKTTSRFAFNKTRLAELPLPETGNSHHYDTKAPGLCLCVTAAGGKAFYFYGRIRGRPRRVKIGNFPGITVATAREVAKEMAGDIARGENPAAERQAAKHGATVADLFAYWLDHAKRHKKTWREDEQRYERFFSPWNNCCLGDLTRQDVEKLHNRIRDENGPYAANRTLALLRAAINKARETDVLNWDGTDPTSGVRKFKEHARERFLQPEEFPRFFKALEEEPPTVRDYFWLALLTGARKSNLLRMRWEQISMDGIWRIPGEEFKNGKPQAIPLIETAKNILQARKTLAGDSPWVFPGPGKGGHLVEVRKAWLRICERAELKDLRIHDLRRTMGSWMASAGASETIIGKSLGHASGSKATAVYARLQLDPVRAAMTTAATAMIESGQKGQDDNKGQ